MTDSSSPFTGTRSTEPDAGGEAFWDGQLAAGASRYRVALGFFNSAEYDTDLVESYYQKFLNRPADPGGLSDWVGAMESGFTAQDVMAGILGSQESYNLSQMVPPTTATVTVTPPANQTNNEGDTVTGVTVTAPAATDTRSRFPRPTCRRA